MAAPVRRSITRVQDADDYGRIHDGVVLAEQIIADGGTLQDAVDETPDGGTLLLARKDYTLTSTLSLRNRKSLTVRAGGPIRVLPEAADVGGEGRIPRLIVGANFGNAPVIDCTGAVQLRLLGWQLKHISGGFSAALVGLLLARDTGSASAGKHELSISIDGKFDYCVFNCGSEANLWLASQIGTRTEGGVGYLTSSWKSIAVDAVMAGGSTVGGSGAQSNVLQTFRNCYFVQPAGGGTYTNNRCVVIEPRTAAILFDQCAFRAQPSATGPILVVGDDADTDPFGVNDITLRDSYSETANCSAWVKLEGDVAQIRLMGGRYQVDTTSGKLIDNPGPSAHTVTECVIDRVRLGSGSSYGDVTGWLGDTE